MDYHIASRLALKSLDCKYTCIHCIFLHIFYKELSQSQSEVRRIQRCWNGNYFLGTTTTTCRPIDFLPTTSLPVQIHSAAMKLVVQSGEQVFLPCRVLNLGEHLLSLLHIILDTHIHTYMYIRTMYIMFQPQTRLERREALTITVDGRRLKNLSLFYGFHVEWK